jgi:hypothetical protein
MFFFIQVMRSFLCLNILRYEGLIYHPCIDGPLTSVASRTDLPLSPPGGRGEVEGNFLLEKNLQIH